MHIIKMYLKLYKLVQQVSFKSSFVSL